MLDNGYRTGRRAARLAVLAVLTGILGACDGVTPMKTYPMPAAEMDPSKPGLLSGDEGSMTLYERK